jgi:hypothetical protein
MLSPLSPYHNAIISVSQTSNPSIPAAIDPISGNWQYNETITQYLAFLKQKSITQLGSFTTNFSQGIDSSSIEVYGYLVEPMFFPKDVIFPVDYKARIRIYSDTWSDGILSLKGLVASAVGADLIVGQSIAGIWKNV